VKHYKAGDVIAYNTFGGGAERITLVVEREVNIKNGQPGFTGTMVKVEGDLITPLGAEFGDEVWGYDHQITRVVKRSTVRA